MKASKRTEEPSENESCSNWDELTRWIAQFSLPRISFSEVGVDAKVWAFRGVKKASYTLKPSIERAAESKSMDWAALEVLVTSEFKARTGTDLIPPYLSQDELTLWANMQHYGIPTRLLDFTYSPYVALYFAVRHSNSVGKDENLRLYAVNTGSLNTQAVRVALKARRAGTASRAKSNPKKPQAASLHPDFFSTSRDEMAAETEVLREFITESFGWDGIRRGTLNRQGCVCAIAPPWFNPRLASQQGLFLLNCAENRTFASSLDKMMEAQEGWQRTVEIPRELAPAIEERLFQMNIHDQSLFPDPEGLAGLIRQKIRLQWT